LLKKHQQKMTASEIADILGLSPQSVRRLINKVDASDTGIHINTLRGKNGGYELMTHSFWTNAGLSDQELTAFIQGEKFLQKRSGFTKHKAYSNGLRKLMIKKQADQIYDVDKHYSVIYRHVGELTLQEENAVSTLLGAIQKTYKVNITYYSLSKNQISRRILHPYQVYVYRGANYVVGFCEKNNDIRDFKVARIKKIELIKTTFVKKETFSFEAYIQDTFGIFKDQSYLVSLKITYPFNHIVMESYYHKDQKITQLSEDTILFEANMRGLTEICTWVLSMGACVQVLGPEILKEKVSENYEKIFKSYNW